MCYDTRETPSELPPFGELIGWYLQSNERWRLVICQGTGGALPHRVTRVIETVFDQLKHLLQIEHTRHRRPTNFAVNVLAGLIAYCHQPTKPSLCLDRRPQLITIPNWRYNTLLDEHAASHIALVQGLKFSVKDRETLSDEAFVADGGNHSLFHVDFMIGSAAMDVDGVRDDGTCEPVMRGGEWVNEP